MPACRRLLRAAAFTAAACAASLSTASAQTTLVLNAPDTHVSDTMIQGGAAANTNFNQQDFFATRASTNADYLRRGLLKFDTQNTLPAGSTVQAATLTLTVKSGGTDAARTIGVFPVTTSFLEEEATWNQRRVSTAWTSAGGDLGAEATRATVPNSAGAKVSFNVTALVRAVVAGGGASRYTRLALADLGASTSASYREFYASEAANAAVRPVLTVVYGGSSTPPPTVNPPPSAVAAVVVNPVTVTGGPASTACQGRPGWLRS